MSDLQDAIDRRDEIIDLSPWADDNALILAGARLVANPNIEAVAILICELVFGEDWDREIPLVQLNQAKRYVAAALTRR